jgi:hypothetical protein
MIKRVKDVVQHFYNWPVALYTLPKILLAGPMQGTTLKLSSVTMQLDEDEQLHDLAVKWIIAVQKARKGWPLSKAARVVFRWISYKKAQDGSWKRKQTGRGTWKFELERERPIIVTESKDDELVLWIDGRDSRSYFPVLFESE